MCHNLNSSLRHSNTTTKQHNTIGNSDPPHAVCAEQGLRADPVNREMPLSAYCSHLATKHFEDTGISVHVLFMRLPPRPRPRPRPRPLYDQRFCAPK
ncbi:unnamed protein product [Ceratitis capitata]|uniref:(Mediterranean fruit fly) hypothetical protein n=1 Tax=Ceratitis capitata TaxID=7213 RepID=A0A811V1D6_CERCA|nr:unnamed protein product [Ceratitis capitata]